MIRRITLQEENFHWNLNVAILPNLLNLNSAYYKIFTKLSMIAYINKFQKSKFANSLIHEFDQSEPGH